VGNPFVSSQPPIYQTPQGGAVGQNYARVGTPEIDALLDQLVATTDRDEQVRIANEVDTQLWDLMPTIPLYQKPTFIAYSSTIDGVEDNPTQAGPLWNASTWTVQ
jgi:peptide/nickel transport system substrate-binding protein